MNGNNDHSTEKQDNKPSPSGGKNRLPLYICAGVVAVALAIGGYFVFADNAANPGVENNLPQDPDDPYNNGGVIATGETTSPTATATISPTQEITSSQQPPNTPQPDDPTLDPASGGDIVVVLTPDASPFNTIVPTATATVAPPPSAAPSKAPATAAPTGTPVVSASPPPPPTASPQPNTPPPPSEAPKTGPEYTDIARSKIAKKAGVVEVIECRWSNAYDAFVGKIKYTDGTVTVTTTYEYYLESGESGLLTFTYQDANGEYKYVGL